MSKPFIFVSCGQFTDAEKRLGKQIVQVVKTLTGLDAFFAENVQDLNGLDSNILGALRDCVGFITVMHPRGVISRPDGSKHLRGSVWIEQEIAIAAYIQRVEKRPLPVIAFIHESVGREGIRDLLQLNPFKFLDDSEILTALPERLASWKDLRISGLRVDMNALQMGPQDGHTIRQLVVSIVNETAERINQWTCEIGIPSGLLKHWSTVHVTEIRKGADPKYRYFRFSEQGKGVIQPHDVITIPFDYCTTCAIADVKDWEMLASISVSESVVKAVCYAAGRERSVEKTVKELALQTSGSTD